VGFDYWSKGFLGEVPARQEIELPGGSCRVIALRRKSAHPQVISTSRHVSQGAVDLTYVRWDNAAGVLQGRSRVVARDDYELRIDAGPAKVVAATAKTGGADVLAAAKQDGRDLRVTLKSPRTGEVEWEIRFAPAAAQNQP
jgi:hypothetical protein